MVAVNRISAPSPGHRMTARRRRQATKPQAVVDTKPKTSTKAVATEAATEARRNRHMAAVDRADTPLSRRDGISGLNRREVGTRDLHRKEDGNRDLHRSRVDGSKDRRRRSREDGSRDRRRRRVGGSRDRLRGRRREGILGRGIRGKGGGIRGRDIVGVDIRGGGLR